MSELVSFLCPTFGRAARQPHLMDEMLYWWMQQTYPHKELVILNDAPDQLLVCRVPGVHIINQPYRSPNLGTKMNMLIDRANGSICIPQEDDDISLPERAEQAIEHLHNYDYWTPGLWFYAQEGQRMIPDNRGVGHNCAAYRHEAMEDGYPNFTKGHDAAAHSFALARRRFNPRCLTDPREITYVYRWGVSDLHLSAFTEMEEKYANADPGPAGYYELVPRMGRDYIKLRAEAAK